MPEAVVNTVMAKCENYKVDTHFTKATHEHIWISAVGFFYFFYVVMVKKYFPGGFGLFPLFMGIAGVCE